ncbi:benzoate-CoA ligase family protein [Inmirania thermothiophila]|uniref:Benzoate-CoA ligase n=1 Tax=Inmirania thermothiophila TaxID=1750597 RepID=A0A3N1Y0V3_9GAMM|nr:benzoate-CoA ligase family protein [Inmirania thermothiophila]ROR32463.1 benzoate-CoA ligase [Inmirania thermothiophila]
MRDHTVAVEREHGRTVLRFAPVFNVAVPFIDRHLAEGRADKVAIRTNHGEAVTYRELAEQANRAGNALRALGIGRGERVLMMVKDCPEFFYLFWGAIKAGIVPVPVNTLLRAKDYRFMIEDSGCAAVVYSPEFAAEVEPALAAADPAPAVRLPVTGEGDSLRARMAEAGAELEAVPASATDDCFWLYSSGSTGNPKGAIHRHRDMVVTSQYYGVETLGVREEDVCFSAAKLFFAYGLGNAMTFPLWVGATAVLYDGRPTPQSTFEMIQRFRPTIYYGVPTLYAAQLAALDELAPDLSSVRVCVSAGEALPPEIFQRWKERTGLTILDGIGSTEALHIFISNRIDDVRLGTSGRLVPGYEARIVDEAGNEVPPGESGRLLIRGDSTARAYWNNPEKTAQTMLEGGWLNTGDTYVRDEEGYFHYCGRSDDMMKVGGIWCSPFEIEARLIEHPAVLEAAVVGRPDEQNLVKPEAWIVLKDPAQAGDALRAELLEHCKKGLAPYKYPRWIHFVDELPKTATGKIQRFKLRARPQPQS